MKKIPLNKLDLDNDSDELHVPSLQRVSDRLQEEKQILKFRRLSENEKRNQEHPNPSRNKLRR